MSFDHEAGAALLRQRLSLPSVQTRGISLLGESPGLRSVVRYQFTGVPDSTEVSQNLDVVGKFYTDPVEGDHCYRSMASLAALLYGLRDAVLAIPYPLFYDDCARFLALEWVKYRPFPRLVAGSRARACLRLAGWALADLHGLPLALGEAKRLNAHFAELITPHPLVLAERLPKFGPRISALLEELLRWEADGSRHWKAAPIHRDFHLRQLFFGARRVWLIDWDQCALGDPALDVGNFLVYLETHLSGATSAGREAFLEGYLQHRGHEVLARLPQYRAFTYLRLCCKAYRLQRPAWEESVRTRLDLAEAALAGQGAL